MIILDDGFKIEGEIENSIVKLNDEWTKILIVKTKLSEKEVLTLFKDNKSFELGNTIYITNGYIKTIVEEGITYTWLKLNYSYQDDNKTKIENLNNQADILNDRLNFTEEVLMQIMMEGVSYRA